MYSKVYGQAPKVLGNLEINGWDEYMHYMYLPVKMAGDWEWDVRLPPRLGFATDAVFTSMEDFAEDIDTRERALRDYYVYLTVRRGWASPGNSLNRPGWHADGFGGEDLNYVWTDRFPTLFALQDFENVETDHVTSLDQFTAQIDDDKIVTYADKTLLRLDPYVVHHVPMEIPAPGGHRSFLKVSISKDKYDLKGNAHNYLFDYEWNMHDRSIIRNDPARHGSDSSKEG
jgi:hypothetical protein